MEVQDIHTHGIGKSALLSGMQVMRAISPIQVVSILNREKISFVLVGAHSLSGWTRKPRATEDVDVVVAEKHLKKATRALLEAFPDLEAEDREVVIRFFEKDSRDVVIDLMKPRGLYRETFKHTHSVVLGGQQCRIPSLEMALTMKFAAMLSPLRQEENKHQDAHDFIAMVKANETLNHEALLQLGELVYGGGGAGLVEMVHKVRAGEKLVL